MRGLCAGLMGMMLVAGGAFAQSADRELSLQFSRYDQLIDRLAKQNQQLMSDVRGLQRDNLVLRKQVEEVTNRTQVVNDQFQQLQNSSIGGLVNGQKQLSAEVARLGDKEIWGSQTRDCAELGMKHQQIKVQTRPDGARTVRFLCFDGKVLHLGTEVYDPAVK